MSGVATAAVVGGVAGGYLTGEANKDAAETAANAKPQFADVLQPGIKSQLGRLEDTNVASFEGDRVADFSGNQQKGISMADALAGRLDQQAGTAGTGFQTFAGGSNVNNNPYLEQDLQLQRDAALRDFSRNQIPSIRNNAVAAGGIGSTRQGIAEGVALSDLNEDLLRADASQRSTQRNQDLTQQLSALINQGNILGGQERGQSQLLRTGALEQGQNQAEIGADRERFDEQNIDQYTRDQDLLSILLGTPAVQGQVPYSTDPLAAGLGTALTTQQLLSGAGTTQPPIPPQPTGIAANATPGFNPASTDPRYTYG